MGFFNEIGRRAEQLKQQVTDAAKEGAMYECEACGTGIYIERETCPDCGSEAVVAREGAADESPGDGQIGGGDAHRADDDDPDQPDDGDADQADADDGDQTGSQETADGAADTGSNTQAADETERQDADGGG